MASKAVIESGVKTVTLMVGVITIFVALATYITAMSPGEVATRVYQIMGAGFLVMGF